MRSDPACIECISSIVATLHPSFAEPVRTLTPPHLEISSQGWGTFPVEAIVYLNDGTEVPISWHLQFEWSDDSQSLPVDITNGTDDRGRWRLHEQALYETLERKRPLPRAAQELQTKPAYSATLTVAPPALDKRRCRKYNM